MNKSIILTLVMFAVSGCAIQQEPVKCELDCVTERVLVGSEIVCEDREVEFTDTVCVMADVVTLVEECSLETHCDVGQYSYINTTCVTSGVDYSGTVCGIGEYSYTDTRCTTEDVDYRGTVCGMGEVTYTDTACNSLNVTGGGEACENITYTRHRTLDFDTDAYGAAISAGQWGDDLKDAYTSWGVTINVENYDGTQTSNGISTFDSSNPTGNDYDLETYYTSSTSAGGHSYGYTGKYTNFFERGNLLIHAEDTIDSDGDGLIDDPDDESGGGRFIFTFDEDVCINSIDLIDVEPGENGYLYAYDSLGNEIFRQKIWGLGDNSVQVVDPGVEELCGVAELIYEMCGSGAIDNVRFYYDEEVETCIGYDYEYDDTTCTDTEVVGSVEVCSDWNHTCDETSCTGVTVNDSIEVCSNWNHTCDETSCSDTLVNGSVEVCIEEEDCIQTPIVTQEEVCTEITLTEIIEVCFNNEVYKEVTTCDESSCDLESEWVQGGGTIGSN